MKGGGKFRGKRRGGKFRGKRRGGRFRDSDAVVDFVVNGEEAVNEVEGLQNLEM